MNRVASLMAVSLGVLALLPGARVSAQSVLPLSLDEARARAVAQVPDVAMQREAVRLAVEAEHRAAAAFDPVVRLESRLRSRTDPLNTLFSGAPDGALGPRTTGVLASTSWSKLFMSGATVTGHASMSTDRTNSLFALLTPAHQAAVGVEVRQPLGQGRRLDGARVRLTLTSLDTARSRAQLERTVSDLVTSVEHAYWSLSAARTEVGIRERALALATAHRRETAIRIEAGIAAEADLATADAAITARRVAVLGATSQATRAELALKALIAGQTDAAVWGMQLDLTDTPPAAPPVADVTDLVAQALARRAEMADVDALVDRTALEERLAGDRLKPQVDLIGGYTLRGLAGRENPDIRLPFTGGDVRVPDDLQGSWGQTLQNALGHRFVDASVGVAVTIPLGNRAARADAAAAGIARTQSEERRRAVALRVAHEVRLAVAQLDDARQRRLAAAEARDAAARQLRAEQDRDAGGVSSAFMLLTRQTDLAQAESTEMAGQADEARAQTELDRATGRLLQTRGIEIGQEPRR
jgi:outer membrane protein TolC